MKILDASVALKWFLVEDEGMDAAESVLLDVEKQPRGFAVPDLFFAEMLHVLCRVHKNEHKAKECLSILEDLGFERIGLGHELLQLAAHLSLRYKISGYDAIYAATAKLTDGVWYTFDAEAAKRLSPTRLAQALS